MRVTLSEQQFTMLSELYQRGGMNSLKNCVKGVSLAEFQTRAIAHGVISEACLFNVDTGLGKTLIASGIINVIRATKAELRWIFVCECRNIKTTYNKLKAGLYNCNVVYSDATDSKLQEVFWTRSAANADVIVLSYESITHPFAEQFLFKNRHLFKGIIIDESHTISNLSSHTSLLLSAIINNTTYRYMLTATPLRINIDQVVNQIYMLDRFMFENESLNTFLNRFKVWDDGRVVGYHDLDTLAALLAPRMFSITRSELGMRGNYTPIPELCPMIPEYKDLPKLEAVKIMKSDPNGPAMQRLYDVVSLYKAQGKKGLVYANLNVIKTAAAEYLTQRGLRVAILDGRHTPTQRKKEIVHEAYLAGEYDALITNVTTGKDLPSDFIIFYEQTFDYTQMIGRGERGLEGKDMDVVFILMEDPVELQFFYNNVYQRGLLLEQVCNKDLSSLHEAVARIESLLDINNLGGDSSDSSY